LIFAGLEQAIAKSKNIVAATNDAAMAICQKIDPFAMKSLLPQLFAALPVEKKWQIRERALLCIATFPATAPRQSGDCLPEIVPEVTACMWDTKKQVKVAATAAMKSALDVIGNKDIEHMTGQILTAITKPKEDGRSHLRAECPVCRSCYGGPSVASWSSRETNCHQASVRCDYRQYE